MEADCILAAAHMPDRTSVVVRVGLLVLLLIGVASIFGESLLGLITHPDPR